MKKECNHTIAIGYVPWEGGTLYSISNIEDSCYEEIDYFDYCPTCGEKLEVKNENNSEN